MKGIGALDEGGALDDGGALDEGGAAEGGGDRSPSIEERRDTEENMEMEDTEDIEEQASEVTIQGDESDTVEDLTVDNIEDNAEKCLPETRDEQTEHTGMEEVDVETGQVSKGVEKHVTARGANPPPTPSDPRRSSQRSRRPPKKLSYESRAVESEEDRQKWSSAEYPSRTRTALFTDRYCPREEAGRPSAAVCDTAHSASGQPHADAVASKISRYELRLPPGLLLKRRELLLATAWSRLITATSATIWATAITGCTCCGSDIASCATLSGAKM
ncbi:hypothetical protein D9C73_008116 [Collichthys lucidus]|uniref:Uncharacterized protein n=1 Tax=Collichthys lucidus TaxID=240159 RepID=A0A4U5UKN3_COLLU|nr:hypothetical protein D9C73_008116 [Collichthys lucidus]